MKTSSVDAWIRGWIALFSIAVPSISGAQAESCTLSHSATVQLRNSDSSLRPHLRATLNGIKLDLALATGLSRTIINHDTSARAGQDLAGGGYFKQSIIGGKIEGGEAYTTDLDVAGLHSQIWVGVTYLPVKSQAHSENFLGADWLSHFDVDLDLAHGFLGLYSAHGDCHGTTITQLISPVYSVDYLPPNRFEARPLFPVISNGQTLTAVFDTTSPVTVISDWAARRIGLAEPAIQAGRSVSLESLAFQPVKGHVQVLDHLILGDLDLHHVPVTVVESRIHDDADVILGLDLGRLLHLWFSSSSRRLVIQMVGK